MPQADWHALEVHDVETALGTSERGLSDAEGAARLARWGENAVAEEQRTGDLTILLRQFQSPLIAILVVAAAISIIAGEVVDAAVIGLVLVVNATIGFTQERQAEAAMLSLDRLLAPAARVMRGGAERVIESRLLVPGDLVLLESGMRAPADVRIVAASGLLVDESLLTGESLAAAKDPRLLPADAVLADRTNMLFSGTIVARGRARGYVVATGPATELGAIVQRVRTERRVATPLQRRVAELARVVTAVVIGASLLVVVVGILTDHELVEMLRVAAALAVSAVPEGLAIAFTVAMAVGVRRMARRHAIVRRIGAVETLGSTTVIGSDKTGTLTENRMTVREVWSAGTRVLLDAAVDPPPRAREPLRLTLLAGVLTNEASLTPLEGGGFEPRGDPTEVALLVAASRLGIEAAQARAEHPMQAELPFEPERSYSASLHDGRAGRALFVKGAPERVIAMCTRMLTEDGAAPVDAKALAAVAEAMAARGLRVLVMAYRNDPPAEADGSLADPSDLTFLGLQGMLDPPRPGVRESVEACRSAGIRVVMITGDHVGTARAIARAVGIPDVESALTGAEIARLEDDELRARVAGTGVFARVSPEQKYLIVRVLRESGEVVAVTGDGANDAPALKAAHIGIAMGRSGTDVTREAADIVLTDDNFVSIRAAVEEGRVTFDNLRRITFFLVSTGAAEVAIVLIALGLGWPLILLPVQILWLNLVTEGLQDIAMAFEPGEPDVLRRPPRRPNEGILSPLLWERTALVGIVMALGTLGLFHWEIERGATLVQSQTAALTTMVLFQVFQAGNARSETRSLLRVSPFSNPFLLIATVGALGLHVASLHLPLTQWALRVEPIDAGTWPIMIAVAASALVAVEVHKLLRRSPSSRV